MTGHEDGVRLCIPDEGCGAWTIPDLRGALGKFGNATIIRELYIGQPFPSNACHRPDVTPSWADNKLLLRGLHTLKGHGCTAMLSDFLPLLSIEDAGENLHEVDLAVKEHGECGGTMNGFEVKSGKSLLDPFLQWYKGLIKVRRDLRPRRAKIDVEMLYTYDRNCKELTCVGTIQIIWDVQTKWRLSYAHVGGLPVKDERVQGLPEAVREPARAVMEAICDDPLHYVLEATGVDKKDVLWKGKNALYDVDQLRSWQAFDCRSQNQWSKVVASLANGKDLTPNIIKPLADRTGTRSARTAGSDGQQKDDGVS